MHPNVAPAIGLELDVEDGEVENYEVESGAESPCTQNDELPWLLSVGS